MRYTGVLVAALLLGQSASAQQPDVYGYEIRPIVGAYVPMGVQRHDFRTATLLGAQAAFEFSEYFHAVGTATWTHGHAKFLTADSDLTHVWQYDLGVEFGAFQELGSGWLFRPFAGAGAGGRTYDYRETVMGTRTCTAGYAALGMEYQKGALGVRLEGRGYASCFESPVTSRQQTRVDGSLVVGLAYHFR